MPTEKPDEKRSLSLPERELELAYAQAAAQESEFADLDCASADGLDDDQDW